MKANTPRAHRFYLQKVAYPLDDLVLPRLSPREERMLTRYGFWLEALAEGKIQPMTEEQQRFVMVARGIQLPLSRYEIAWVKSQQKSWTHV